MNVVNGVIDPSVYNLNKKHLINHIAHIVFRFICSPLGKAHAVGFGITQQIIVIFDVNPCLAKFSSIKECRKALLQTGERELVEASPRDATWGIGFNAKTAVRVSRDKWGQNLLGKVLMRVRSALRE